MRVFPVTVYSAETGGEAAGSEPAAVSSGDLAGLFAAELAAERGDEPPQAEAPPETEPEAEAAPDEAAPAEEAAPEEGTEPETDADPEDGAEEPPVDPALAAPPGMSEADKAEFAKLPPALQTFINKRITEQTADYTRKTMQVAEQRKHYETGATQLQQQLQHYNQILSQFTSPQIAPPDPALRNTDPLAYEEQMADYVHKKHLQEVAAAEQQKVRSQHEELSRQQMAEFHREEAKALAEMAPELADPQKGTALRKGVYDYGVKAGYSPDQLSMASARDMVTLWKAQRYDAIQAAKGKAKVVTPTAPKAAKPGPAKAVGRPSNIASAVRNLAENPSRDALAAAFAAELAAERR